MTSFSGFTRGINSLAHQTSAEASTKASRAEGKVEEIVARLDRTLLACEAMWTILRDRLGVTEEELLQRINEIDMSDGKLDGKVRRPAVTCASCGRNFARRFKKCMYCGAVAQADPFS